MTLRDQAVAEKPLSAWALRAASALRDAGEDGIGYADLREQLGISPSGPLEELRRRRYVIGEDRDVYYLVHDPATSTEAPGTAPASAPPAGHGVAGVSVDAAPTLFDPRTLRMAA